MGAHCVVTYQEVFTCYHHALPMRVVILGDVQRLASVCPILITNRVNWMRNLLKGLNSMEVCNNAIMTLFQKLFLMVGADYF